MKLIKKTAAFILILSLVLGLAACGKTAETEADNTQVNSGGSSETGNKNDSNDSTAELEHMTISIGYWDANEKFDVENDQVLKNISEKFNVTFESMSVSWSDFMEKYKLWAAAGELPDLFATNEINSETYETWVSQGIVRSLPSDLSSYPNLENVIVQADVQPLKFSDGNFYMIPRMNYKTSDMWALDRGVVVRKDWLEALNLEVPSTYEEYEEVLTAFVENDPDGNGSDDTVGLTHKEKAQLEAFFLGSVPQVTNGGWIEEGGQWIPAFMSENTITGIKQLKGLFENGLLDKDFAIMQTFDGLEKFAQGQAGMVTTQVTPFGLIELKDKWEKYDHDIAFEDAVTIAPFWAHEDGNNYSFVQTTYWSETYFNGTVDDAKMDRILMILDYLATDEFKMYKNYGIEGVDYEKDGDAYTILREKDENGDFVSVQALYPSLAVFGSLLEWDQQSVYVDNQVNNLRFGEAIMTMSLDFLEYSKNERTPTPTNFDVKLMVTPAKSKLSAIKFFDDVTKVIILDTDPEEEWKAILEGYKAQGVDKAIEEVNAAVGN